MPPADDPSPAPPPPARPRRARWAGPALIGGSFLVLAFLNAWAVLRAPSAEDGTTAALVNPANPRWTLADPLDGTPRAAAWFDRAGDRLLLFAKGVEAPAAGRTYVLWWLPAGGGPARRAGAFRPRPGLGADLLVADAVSPRDLDGLLLTEESRADPDAPDTQAVRAVARAPGEASRAPLAPTGR